MKASAEVNLASEHLSAVTVGVGDSMINMERGLDFV